MCLCIWHLYFILQVFGPETTQKEIFDGTVKGLVKNVLEGGNTLVFTYGVTNAGKTFTFLGLYLVSRGKILLLLVTKPGFMLNCIFGLLLLIVTFTRDFSETGFESHLDSVFCNLSIKIRKKIQ